MCELLDGFELINGEIFSFDMFRYVFVLKVFIYIFDCDYLDGFFLFFDEYGYKLGYVFLVVFIIWCNFIIGFDLGCLFLYECVRFVGGMFIIFLYYFYELNNY